VLQWHRARNIKVNRKTKTMETNMRNQDQLISVEREFPTKAPKYEVWNEDSTPFRRHLRLDASTYKSDAVFETAPAPWKEGGDFVVSPSASFAYQNRVVPKGVGLRLYGREQGEVVWNGDVAIPTLIDLSRHCHTGEPFVADTLVEYRVKWGAVWMSLTPMEMMTQRGGVKMASGTVVIGGLGLGWLLKKVCEKPEVERVIVVEKSRELLDWFGNRLCGRFAKVKTVICDDIYNHLGNYGPAAKYLLDIWHLFTGALNDDKLWPYRRKLRRRMWAWGLD
jgi:hypothetical protein